MYVSLVALAAVLVWIGFAGVFEGLQGREIVLGLALLPVLALGVRAIWGRLGAVLALVTTGISAFVGGLAAVDVVIGLLSQNALAGALPDA